MTIREVNELKTLRIMRLVMDNFMPGEAFTNKDVKRLIERDNRWASGEKPMPCAMERCFQWMATHCESDITVIAVGFDGGCNVIDAETNHVLHIERDNYQPHELPTGKSFSDRFKYAPWVDMRMEQFAISEETIATIDEVTKEVIDRRPRLADDVYIPYDETIINEPFYGERYVFSINNMAERVYKKLKRDYEHGVQLCVTSCALKFMARFGLTAQEYADMVNKLVE